MRHSEIAFPAAKINLGLNVVERRPDGYHNLQTVFYPVPIMDVLEVTEMHEAFPSTTACDLKVTGINIEGNEQRNLVVRAYKMMKEEYPALPRLHAHLYKGIPTQAGMGGGSSDCAAMLSLLNQIGELQLTESQLIERAARLGADCPFFILNQPAYAEGIGEQLHPLSLSLKGWYLCVVRPNIPVPTREAFAHVEPHQPDRCCLDVVKQPVETWRDLLVNDFEQSVFMAHPQLASVKSQLYDMGAVYAAMSGSGSALFGLFRQPVSYPATSPDTFTACLQL